MTKAPQKRPETALFLSVSVDGRITSHDSDPFDTDKTWKDQPGVRAILQRFYDFSDPHTCSLTTGLAMKKAGVNFRVETPQKMNVPLIVFDAEKDLTPRGMLYLSQCVKHLYIIGYLSIYKKLKKKPKNLIWIPYEKRAPLLEVMHQLYTRGVRAVVMHSAGLLNARWIAEGLVDHLTVIVAPLLVGKNGTSMLMDTVPFSVRPLTLVETRAISDSYLFLRYDVGK